MKSISVLVLALLAAGCGPVPVGTSVNCDAGAAQFKLFRPTEAEKIVLAGKGSLTGSVVLEEFRRSAKFGSFLSIVAQGPEQFIYTEMMLSFCKDAPEAVCTGTNELAGKGQQSAIKRLGAGYARGEEIPLRIDVVTPRQWNVSLGRETTSLSFAHPVDGLQFKCVGARGRFRIEPIK